MKVNNQKKRITTLLDLNEHTHTKKERERSYCSPLKTHGGKRPNSGQGGTGIGPAVGTVATPPSAATSDDEV